MSVVMAEGPHNEISILLPLVFQYTTLPYAIMFKKKIIIIVNNELFALFSTSVHVAVFAKWQKKSNYSLPQHTHTSIQLAIVEPDLGQKIKSH